MTFIRIGSIGVYSGTVRNARELSPGERAKETILTIALAAGMGSILFGFGAIMVSGLASAVGLIDAWAGLVQVATSAMSPSADFVGRFAASLIFGVFAGFTMGLLHIASRRSRKAAAIVEAIISPEAVGAFRIGLGCVAMHILISIIVTALVAWLTDFTPHIALSDGLSTVFVMAGGGGGSPPEFDASNFVIGVFVLVLVSGLLAGIVVCEGLTLVAWMLSPAVSAAFDGAATGATFGGASAVVAYVLRYNLRDLRTDPHEYISTSGAMAATHGAIVGAFNGAFYAVFVLVFAMVFGVQLIATQ